MNNKQSPEMADTQNELKKAFTKYLSKLSKMQAQFSDITEESTKTALVMPFFSMLGYDVFNPEEFVPEYTCDVATKKGEKVDYAIMKDGDPIMLIECKRAGMKLQKQQQGQLYRYFSTNRCRIAILTNGITYHFFSDLNAPNVMDDEPFLSINLLDDDYEVYFSSLSQFSKSKFSVKDVIAKAVFQKYSKVVQKTLREDLISPSDEIVKYFLSRPEIKSGNRITSQMIDKYREATQIAMQKVFNAVIRNDENTEDTDTDTDTDADADNEPMSIDSIIKYIQDTAKNKIDNCTFQTEQNEKLARIHIYTGNNQKYGIVNISLPDLNISFKKFINGIPTVNELHDISDLDALL